jgi:tyrosine-protein phosphatase YwqE
VKRNSLAKSSSIFQRFETVDDGQRSEPFTPIDQYYSTLRNLSPTISNEELTHLLDKFTFILNPVDDIDRQQQQLSIINDTLNALIDIHPSALLSTSQNEFFSIIQTTFIHIIRRWHRLSSLQDDEFLMFRMMTKLIERFITATHDVRLLPSWLTDSTLLEAISNCLTNIVTSGNFLQNNSKTQFKYFTRLIDAYILYQQQLNDQNHFNKDLLVQLLDPILHCLTSPQFIHTFANLPIDAKSMTTIEKFFLVKCPAFLTSYNGNFFFHFE